MRTSKSFIEVTGGINGKKFLVNKSAIIFVTQEDGTNRAVIETIDGDRHYRIIAKEKYDELANNLLNWIDIKLNPYFAEPGACAPEKEDGND